MEMVMGFGFAFCGGRVVSVDGRAVLKDDERGRGGGEGLGAA